MQGVVELIRVHFGQKSSSHEPPDIPNFPVPSHDEPRFSCFIESEAAGVSIEIFCWCIEDQDFSFLPFALFVLVCSNDQL